MKFRPLHDRVLIKVLDSEEKTKGGIIIPDTAKEKPHWGTSGVPFINRQTSLAFNSFFIFSLVSLFIN